MSVDFLATDVVKTEIGGYEAKYGFSYSEFRTCFKTLSEHTWETESALFDWGAATTDLQALEETMRSLDGGEELGRLRA